MPLPWPDPNAECETEHADGAFDYYNNLDAAIHLILGRCICGVCWNAWSAYYDLLEEYEEARRDYRNDTLDENDYGCAECGQRLAGEDADTARLRPMVRAAFNRMFATCFGSL